MIAFTTRIAAGDRGEDRLAVARTPTGAVVVIADGAGGVGGAAVAAQFICDFLTARALKTSNDDRSWSIALCDADAALFKESHGGLTTTVVVEIRENYVLGASVGDSGAWMISESGIVDLTAGQSRKPLVGSGDARPTAFGPIPWRGRLLVATDGIFKYARHDVIADRALNGFLDDAADALLNAVRLPNGRLQDDAALILVEYSD